MTFAAIHTTEQTMLTSKITKSEVSDAHIILRCQAVGYFVMKENRSGVLRSLHAPDLLSGSADSLWDRTERFAFADFGFSALDFFGELFILGI